MSHHNDARGVNVRQGWYGPTYVNAICAQAGYLWTPTPGDGDVHSFDGAVAVKPGVQLPVQVKCRRGRVVRSASYRIKPAWRKNWEELDLPAFFVVVLVPDENVGGWVEHESKPSRRTVHNTSALWTRIDPLPASQSSIQVVVNRRLTAETILEWREMYMQARAAFGGGTG